MPRNDWGSPPSQQSTQAIQGEILKAIEQIASPQVKGQFEDAVERFQSHGATMDQWSRLLQLAQAEAHSPSNRPSQPRSQPQPRPGQPAKPAPPDMRNTYSGMKSGYRSR